MLRLFSAIPWSHFLGNGNLLSIILSCSGYIRRCSIEAVSHWISLPSIHLGVFHRDRQLFCFLISASSTWTSSWVKYPSFILSWLLIIFMIGLPVTLGEFPNRFFKCSLFVCIRSSWLAALNVFFLPLTSFTVGHAIRDCLSSTEFLILLIWARMYSICSMPAFLNFWTLALVEFLL